jgi:hypothetical protein
VQDGVDGSMMGQGFWLKSIKKVFNVQTKLGIA